MKTKPIYFFIMIFIVMFSGCQSLMVEDQILPEPSVYEELWQNESDAIFLIDRNEYRAVYTLNDTNTIDLYHVPRANIKKSLEISNVAFRYTNGTILPQNKLIITENRSSTLITTPNSYGEIAFTSNRDGKSFQAPISIVGNYTVILPENAVVDIALLSRVVPSGYSSEYILNQENIHWKMPPGEAIYVQYYLIRDSQLLAVLLVFCGFSLIIYSIVYWIKIKKIKQKTRELDPHS
jgi:hypothetical protein